MKTATTSFIEAVQSWTQAVQASDFQRAKQMAQFIKIRGDLLAIRPEFKACFTKHCPDFDTIDALTCLGQFIHCATECNERATQSG